MPPADKKQITATIRCAFGPAPGREWWGMDYKTLELGYKYLEPYSSVMDGPSVLEVYRGLYRLGWTASWWDYEDRRWVARV
jgi:hypothetical protein